MHDQISSTFPIFQCPEAFEELLHSSPPIFTPTTQKMYATTTQGPCLVPLPPTPVPSPSMIPLPTPDTRTMASTHWGTPDYVPCTPSPQAPWRPTTANIDSNHGLATEHAAFVVNRGVMYGLSLPTSILANRNATIRGPRSGTPPLPVPAPASPTPIQAPQALVLTTIQL